MEKSTYEFNASIDDHSTQKTYLLSLPRGRELVDIAKEINKEQNKLLATVKELHKQTNWPIFPVSRENKRPYIKFKTLTPQESSSNIERWWGKEFRGAMIGSKTGHCSNLLVIDCDGPEGEEEFLSYCSLYNYEPRTSTYWQKTPGCGSHFFYKMPTEDIRNSVKVFDKHVDIRGNGGMIICSPSKRLDGLAYRRMNQLEPQHLPSFLLRKLLIIEDERLKMATSTVGKQRVKCPKVSTVVEEKPQQSKAVVNNSGKRRYAIKVLDNQTNQVASAQKGARNQTLFKAACQCGKYIQPNALGEDEVIEKLLFAAEKCGYINDDGRTATMATINNGLAKGKANLADLGFLEEIKTFCTGEKMPDGYFIRRGGKKPGLWHRLDHNSKMGDETWLGSEFHILGEFRDESNQDWGFRIQWEDGDTQTHYAMISQSMLASRARMDIFAELASGGWRQSCEKNASILLLALFSTFHSENRYRKITKTGWVGDVFVFPDEMIERTQETDSDLQHQDKE